MARSNLPPPGGEGLRVGGFTSSHEAPHPVRGGTKGVFYKENLQTLNPRLTPDQPAWRARHLVVRGCRSGCVYPHLAVPDLIRDQNQ
ncbi:MAG: hypothetical protein ACJAZW_001115 [Maritalea sp.]|jgi:hypothetical protein